MFSRRKKLIQVENNGMTIKHYDRIDRQMTEFLFLGELNVFFMMIKQQNTEKKHSLFLTEEL